MIALPSYQCMNPQVCSEAAQFLNNAYPHYLILIVNSSLTLMSVRNHAYHLDICRSSEITITGGYI